MRRKLYVWASSVPFCVLAIVWAQIPYVVPTLTFAFIGVSIQMIAVAMPLD